MQLKFCTETTLILRNRSANQESKLVIFKCKLVYRNYMSSFCPRFEKLVLFNFSTARVVILLVYVKLFLS